MIERPSPNQDDRPAPPDMLVLHYTGMQSGAAAVARLRDTAARVSSHYVVDEDGSVYRLVPEARRAWHAGVSYWRGRETLNDVSIGIEIVNPGHEWGYRPFPPAQIGAVIRLCHGIVARHDIPPAHVVGHSDIAPNRKQDPGELFPWAQLAAEGIGLWAEPGGGGDPGDAMTLLARIGYDTRHAARDVLTAFQRRFLPDHLTGQEDAGTCARLAEIAALYG